MASSTGAGQTLIDNNGWQYNYGVRRAESYGNFLNRTVHQSYVGVAANDPQEAIYISSVKDSDGRPLKGGEKYLIPMPAGMEPEVNGFWSFTLYDNRLNMVDNEIHRYSIGDRKPSLVRDAEGGLTIAVQSKRPTDENANWLPSPAEGEFFMILRTYQLGESLLKNKWQAPPVTVLDYSKYGVLDK